MPSVRERLRVFLPGPRGLGLAVLAGVSGALAVSVFHLCLAFAERHISGSDQGLVAAAAVLGPWRRLLTPALAALAAGCALWAFAHTRHERSAHPPAEYIEGILAGGGRIDTPGSLIKCLASVLVVSGGLAVGREGAMILLASLTASCMARRFAPQRDWPLLTACGAAAGVAAAYHAPVAGTFFALELILGTVAPAMLIPAALAASASLLVTRALGGTVLLYPLPMPAGQSVALYLAALLLALAGACCGSAFLRGMDAARAVFRSFSLPQPLRLGLGGLIVGLLSLGVPEVWGNGYSVIERCLAGADAGLLPAKLAALFLAAKLLAMLAGSGAGAPGGFFTPTLFLGATAGSLTASALAPWFGVGPEAVTLILLAMAVLLAATTHAPLMAACMVCEISGAYTIFPLLLAASFTASALARRIRPLSIYGMVRAGTMEKE